MKQRAITRTLLQSWGDPAGREAEARSGRVFVAAPELRGHVAARLCRRNGHSVCTDAALVVAHRQTEEVVFSFFGCERSGCGVSPGQFHGVTADLRTYNNSRLHVVGDKYARAVWEAADCTPMIIPALAESQQVHDMLDSLDGLMFTGSPSNVHPTRYGQEPHERFEPYDEARDAMTFRLIDAALEKGLPCLFICRGFQELNAALGGTLHPRLHEVEGRMDHRMPRVDDMDVRYGLRHAMRYSRWHSTICVQLSDVGWRAGHAAD